MKGEIKSDVEKIPMIWKECSTKRRDQLLAQEEGALVQEKRALVQEEGAIIHDGALAQEGGAAT